MLGVGLLLLAGVLWFGIGPGATPPPTSVAIHPTDVAGTLPSGAGTDTHVAPPPTSVAPVAVHTLVSLESTPSGATVGVDDDTYGPTPTSFEWTGEDATPGREVTFVFHLAGHQDYSVVRTVLGDTLDVSATLQALPTGRPFRPRPPRRPEGDDGTAPVGPVKGYKLDPY
jgi:hypothetical protein